MKAIFISYNQIMNDNVHEILDRNYAKGFTKWELTHGKGSNGGEPHFGNHTWPSMNSSIITIVEEKRVKPILDGLRALNDKLPAQGLRAFVWAVEDGI